MSIGSSFTSYGYRVPQRPASSRPAASQVQFGEIENPPSMFTSGGQFQRALDSLPVGKSLLIFLVSSSSQDNPQYECGIFENDSIPKNSRLAGLLIRRANDGYRIVNTAQEGPLNQAFSLRSSWYVEEVGDSDLAKEVAAHSKAAITFINNGQAVQLVIPDHRK